MTADLIEFGNGVEPCSVARGGVKRWLHCTVRDIGSLPAAWRDELTVWLAALGIHEATSLTVTRGDSGHRVDAAGCSAEVALADLPPWLREPTAPSKVPAKPKASKAQR